MTDTPDPMDQVAKRFRADIERAVPALTGAALSILGEGWDSTAVLAAGHTVLKFPKNYAARRALRREVAILATVRPHLTINVPAMSLHEGPPLISSHRLIPGDQLLTSHYLELSDDTRDALARDLARFHAELHGIDRATMTTAGALQIGEWLSVDEVREKALPFLHGIMADLARSTLDAYAALPPDPLGQVYGFFDGHGWNMAFDHASGHLNGMYDFADSGFGPRHQEFIYCGMISTDLMERLMTEYQRLTGQDLDRQRVRVLFGMHRLVELAQSHDDPENRPIMLRAVNLWAKSHVP